MHKMEYNTKKNERTIAYNMGGSYTHNVTCKKPDPKEDLLYGLIYIEPKAWTKPNCSV